MKGCVSGAEAGEPEMRRLGYSVVAILLVAGVGCQSHINRPAAAVFNVRNLGATGDGKTNDTAAFQAALNAAASAKGGQVIVPAGNYVIGSVVMGSNTTLRLDEGATLIGSPDAVDYPIVKVRWEGVWRDGHRALLFAADARHVAIVGPGRIVGDSKLGHLRNPRGPCLIEFISCEDVHLQGFSAEYERMWAIHPTYCKNVSIRDLTIRSRLDNGDGIDVDSSQQVQIDNCDNDTGDDAIALKSGRGAEGASIGRPTQDVTIRNCTLGSRFAALAIGTEMSGGIRNVRAERCTFTHGSNSIFIKSRTGRGGFIDDIQIRDCDARAGCLLRIDLLGRGITGADPIPGTDGIPRVSRISIGDIRTTCPTVVDAVRIAPEKPLQGLRIHGISGTCRRGIELANIRDADLRDIAITGFAGAKITISNVSGSGLADARQRPATQPATSSSPSSSTAGDVAR
jgi:hypothetical protein